MLKSALKCLFLEVSSLDKPLILRHPKRAGRHTQGPLLSAQTPWAPPAWHRVCVQRLKHGSDRGDGFRLGRFRTLSARSVCPTGITTVRTPFAAEPGAVTRPAGGGRGEIEHHAVEPGDAKEDVPGAKVPSRPCRLLATSRTVFAWTVTVTFLDCPVSHRGF